MGFQKIFGVIASCILLTIPFLVSADVSLPPSHIEYQDRYECAHPVSCSNEECNSYQNNPKYLLSGGFTEQSYSYRVEFEYCPASERGQLIKARYEEERPGYGGSGGRRFESNDYPEVKPLKNLNDVSHDIIVLRLFFMAPILAFVFLLGVIIFLIIKKKNTNN